MRRMQVLVAAGMLAALAGCSSIGFQSGPGEPFARGTSGEITSTNGTVTLTGDAAGITVTGVSGASAWTVALIAPAGGKLGPGTFALSSSPDAEHAGISIFHGTVAPCLRLTGTATITGFDVVDGLAHHVVGTTTTTCADDPDHPLTLKLDVRDKLTAADALAFAAPILPVVQPLLPILTSLVPKAA
ncbi:MAG: lipoprotein [Acidimicrobiia bacterium]